MSDPSRIVVLGAGAIGCSLAAWMAPVVPGVALMARGETADALERAGGVRIYAQGQAPELVPVPVVRELPPADTLRAVLLTVKTYSLPPVCAQVLAATGPDLPVMGVQNGLEGPALLQERFSRAAHGVAFYNAWVDAPGVVGFQQRGPLLVGGHPALKALTAEMGQGLSTRWTERLHDVAHVKVVINLANSLTALLGFGQRPVRRKDLLQRLVGNLLMDGVRTIQAAGHKEVRVQRIPPWWVLRASASLPRWLTAPIFEANMKKMVVSSMGQDLASRSDTELEAINGYVLQLAREHGVATPTLEVVTGLARRRFAQRPFVPMSEEEVWQAVLDGGGP